MDLKIVLQYNSVENKLMQIIDVINESVLIRSCNDVNWHWSIRYHSNAIM